MWTFNVHQSPAAIPMSSTATVYPPQPKNNYDYKEREHTHSDLQCRENLTKPCPILVRPRSDSLVCEVIHMPIVPIFLSGISILTSNVFF